MERMQASWHFKRKVLVKAEEETNFQYGCRPDERPIDDYVRLGVISLDKTAGPSSHEVTARAKRILGLDHAGHGGTLEVSNTEIRDILK